MVARNHPRANQTRRQRRAVRKPVEWCQRQSIIRYCGSHTCAAPPLSVNRHDWSMSVGLQSTASESEKKEASATDSHDDIRSPPARPAVTGSKSRSTVRESSPNTASSTMTGRFTDRQVLHVSDCQHRRLPVCLLTGDDDSHNEDRDSQTIKAPQPSKWERDDSDDDSRQQSPHSRSRAKSPSPIVTKYVSILPPRHLHCHQLQIVLTGCLLTGGSLRMQTPSCAVRRSNRGVRSLALPTPTQCQITVEVVRYSDSVADSCLISTLNYDHLSPSLRLRRSGEEIGPEGFDQDQEAEEHLG